jgi:putative transcriptional regulator
MYTCHLAKYTLLFLFDMLLLFRGGLNLDENIQLKNRLKIARAEKNLSQEQLAILAGVTRQTISSIETGQYCPTAKLALILSKVLNKQFEDLFYFEEGIHNDR